MPDLRKLSTAAIAASLILTAAGCSDEGSDPSTAACAAELLAGASLNTDSFPTIQVETGEVDPRWATLGEVDCAGTSRAANITYLVGDLDPELPADTAVDGRYAVVEPGGDPASRLEDPGTTWSDHPGVDDLVQRLAADGAVRFQLAAPAPDRGPVHLMASAIDDEGRAWLVAQFSEDADVNAGVQAIVAELPSGLSVDGEPKVDGTEATIQLTMPAEAAQLLSIDLDLALARRR